MKYFKRFSIVLCIFFFSCNNSPTILKLPKKAIEISHEEMSCQNADFYRLYELDIIDSLLFLYDETEDFYFALFNLNTKSLMFRFGTKGRGPGELYIPMFPKCNIGSRLFEVSTIQPRGLVQYNIDSLLKYEQQYSPKVLKVESENVNILTVNRLNDSLYLGKGYMDSGQFALINNEGKTLSVQENYPVDENKSNIDQALIGLAYQGEIESHPSKSKFVYIAGVGFVFELCEMNSNLEIRKKVKYYNNFPEFSIVNGSAANSPKNVVGFRCLYTTENYIYTLYSELDILTYSQNPYSINTILVFNWDGVLERRYNTDIGLASIAVCNNDKIIYGVAANPEPIIVKFEI